MRPIRRSITLAAAVSNGICQSQTPGAGGNLTLNGSLVSGGIATLDSNGHARPVLLTCAGNETARTFTIYGTISDGGAVVSESIAGVNATTTTTTVHFLTVTRVAVDAATAGAVTLGTNGVGSCRCIPLCRYVNPVNVGFAIEVAASSPVTWTFEYTFDDLQDRDLTPSSVRTYADSSFTSKSTNLNGNIIAPCTGVRLKIESGTSAATLNVIQAGPGHDAS